MADEEQVAALEAAQGERMIEIKIRFWTNNIASGEGKVLPKHAWTSGVVRMASNRSHGITPAHPRPFHSLLDVGAVIERVLIEHGITLYPSRRTEKYIAKKE
jgi:hypothetical protein